MPSSIPYSRFTSRGPTGSGRAAVKGLRYKPHAGPGLPRRRLPRPAAPGACAALLAFICFLPLSPSPAACGGRSASRRAGTAATAGAEYASARGLPVERGCPTGPAGFLDLEFVNEVVEPSRTFANRIRYVSQDTLRSTIEHLENYGTRYYESFQIIRAAEWLKKRLLGMGYGDVYFQDVRDPQGRLIGSKNVVAVKAGGARPQFRILVGGHYDSIVHGFPLNVAPGADDNASGTAGALEIARILSNAALDATVEFVFFTAEEIGLYGSEEFAAECEEDGVPTDELFCINMDMIANSESEPWAVRFYYDRRSTPLAQLAARVGEAYTDLVPYLSGWSPYSDHAPFSRHGYPALFVQEYDENMLLHTPDDRLVNLEVDYAAEVVRMVAALVLHLGVLADPPEAVVATRHTSGETTVQWSHSTDADVIGYNLELLDYDKNLLGVYFTSENSLALDVEQTADAAWARVRAVDVLGEGSPSHSVSLGGEGIVFSGAVPNPARSHCRFELFVPGAGGPVNASFKIVDAYGRLVRSVHEGSLSRGPHVFDWNTLCENGSAAPEGVYFYALEIDGLGRERGKLVVVR